jgi:hypothetical protein
MLLTYGEEIEMSVATYEAIVQNETPRLNFDQVKVIRSPRLTNRTDAAADFVMEVR